MIWPAGLLNAHQGVAFRKTTCTEANYTVTLCTSNVPAARNAPFVDGHNHLANLYWHHAQSHAEHRFAICRSSDMRTPLHSSGKCVATEAATKPPRLLPAKYTGSPISDLRPGTRIVLQSAGCLLI